MVKEKLNLIINKTETILINNHFIKRGNKNSYVKKNKNDYNRQEHIDFNGRQHREDKDAIFITGTVGIYYPSVRKIYALLLKDHLSDYPIIAGNMGNFIPNGKSMYVYYKEGSNDLDVEKEIEENLIKGAFYLLETFPDLNSIYEGILNHHPFLRNFYLNVDYSTKILIVSIIYILYGKEKACLYLKENIEEEQLEYLLNNISAINI